MKKKSLPPTNVILSHVYSTLSNACFAGAVNNEEEVGWDDDSDNGGDEAQHQAGKSDAAASKGSNQNLSVADKDGHGNGGSPRRSNDQQSQADSESSYDLVSGSASRAAESPKEKTPLSSTAEDSDEEDWE